MKTFLILALISLPTFACPDLQGTYARCTSQKGILEELTDLHVRKIPVPHMFFYQFKSPEMGELLFPTNRVEIRLNPETVMTAACLGTLVQARTTVTRDGVVVLQETSQYFKQGDDLVRISRGQRGEEKYTDILTCR